MIHCVYASVHLNICLVGYLLSNYAFRTWTHRHTHTLDKNGSLYDPAGTESCDMHIRLVTKIRMSIYIYMGLWWPPAASYNCAQVRHHSPAGTFTRVPGRCLRWSPTSQGPRWPPAYRYIKYKKFYVYSDGTHTHPASGRVVRVKMRWRWGWTGDERWDESENEMKVT